MTNTTSTNHSVESWHTLIKSTGRYSGLWPGRFRPSGSPAWAGLVCLVAWLMGIVTPAAAQEREGDYLYKVSTARAAPGKLEALLEWADALKESDYFEESGEAFPFIMRHSQGDQWDLMFILPMESWTAYYSPSATQKRKQAEEKYGADFAPGADLFAFDEDHFAYGPPLEEVAREYGENSFFHIEMFHAAPGKEAELTEQRRMENEYLDAIGLTTNMIFRRAAGSDVDVFTIGFHESLEAFAKEQRYSRRARSRRHRGRI